MVLQAPPLKPLALVDVVDVGLWVQHFAVACSSGSAGDSVAEDLRFQGGPSPHATCPESRDLGSSLKSSLFDMFDLTYAR